jgi:hypothetical protein
MSRAASARSFFRRLFSSSSAFRRLTSTASNWPKRGGRCVGGHPIGTAGVGLRSGLRALRPAARSAAGLEPLLQLAPPAPRHQSQVANEPSLDFTKEPLDSSQLVS